MQLENLTMFCWTSQISRLNDDQSFRFATFDAAVQLYSYSSSAWHTHNLLTPTSLMTHSWMMFMHVKVV